MAQNSEEKVHQKNIQYENKKKKILHKCVEEEMQRKRSKKLYQNISVPEKDKSILRKYKIS